MSLLFVLILILTTTLMLDISLRLLKIEVIITFLITFTYILISLQFIKILIDKHKIIGYVIFDNENLYISNLDIYINYNNIKEILICGASASGNDFFSNSYFLIIKQKNENSLPIHLSREQYDNNKYKKTRFWNNNKDIIDTFKELKLKYTYKREIYLIDK